MNVLINIKKNIIRMAHYSHASHVGSALSVVDILFVLYSKIIKPADKVILSKGHASSALYATLAEFDHIDKSYLEQYYINDGKLPGHLDKDSVSAISASTGSLGHGLSLGLGMALADKSRHVYVILGDGECNEGSIWEAFILMGKLKLQNITIVIDHNNLQGYDKTDVIADYSRLSSTLSNFGLSSMEIDGHNLKELEIALKKSVHASKVIIAHTIKGHGISFMENELKWHYKSPNDEELKQALDELGMQL